MGLELADARHILVLAGGEGVLLLGQGRLFFIQSRVGCVPLSLLGRQCLGVCLVLCFFGIKQRLLLGQRLGGRRDLRLSIVDLSLIGVDLFVPRGDLALPLINGLGRRC